MNITTDDISLVYDEWHRHMGEHTDCGRPLDFPWYASAAELLGRNPQGNLLEVGCGRGDFARWLAGTSPQLQITAVDFSPAAIHIANARLTQTRYAVRFVVGDAQSLALPSNHFDWVVSCECMEHVPKPRAMASELSRVLRPGGKFVLTTENYLNGMSIGWLHSAITGRPFNSGSGVQPIENFFLFFQVKRYLEEAGLIVDEMTSCHYQWLLLPGIDPARLCTTQFKSTLTRRIARPFGRHFSFFGHKP